MCHAVLQIRTSKKHACTLSGYGCFTKDSRRSSCMPEQLARKTPGEDFQDKRLQEVGIVLGLGTCTHDGMNTIMVIAKRQQ